MGKNFQIIASPDSLNGALETWFVQNDLFRGAPYNLTVNPESFGDAAIIYLELHQMNLDLINHIKSLGNKLILYHMGGERLDKDISAYAACDLIVRNYYFSSIINQDNLGGKVIWAPNGFRTGVGPRPSRQLKIAEHRQSLASFLGWLNNAASFNNERASFSIPARDCGENLYLLPSNGFAGGIT